MQPRDLFRRRRPDGDATPPRDEPAADAPEAEGAETIGTEATTPSIRDRQKRRRDALRNRQDISTFLGTAAELADPDLESEEDEDESDDAPAPVTIGQVYVVFRAVSWSDGDASLRESDSLVGIHATEAGARSAVAALDLESRGEAEHWYQPYKVAG